MEISEKIPVLSPDDLSHFHHTGIDWQPFISEPKHQYYHINRIETYVNHLELPYPPHRKTVNDFIFLTKGKSVRSKGLTKYEFGPNEIFFLPAFQITEHESMSEDAEGFFFHFDENIFQFLPLNYINDNFPFFQLESHPVVSISVNTQKQILSIFERLVSIYQNEIETNFELVAAYLLALFEEIKKDYSTDKKKTKSTFSFITEKYKNALTLHIYKKQTISEFAHILNISPNYLNKCVKNSINKTAQDLLNEMLILEAKTLLKYSNLQIAEIAVKLCNRTPSNFSRFFKKETGLTPKEYLSMH